MTDPLPEALRPSASLVVVRAAAGGIEVLMLERAASKDQNSAAWVFPGGSVDRGDRACHVFSQGLDDAAASATLGLPQGGLDRYVAAIRECFEEAGLLFAADADGHLVSLQGEAGAGLAAARGALHRGEVGFAPVCREHGLRLATDRLAYIAHWVTPLGLAKRFDTRFFLGVMPQAQASAHAAVEIVDHAWLRPAELLAAANARRLLKVTRSIVEMIEPFADIDALVDWARSPRPVPCVMQRRCLDGGGPRMVMPEHAAWAEIGRLDPLGAGTSWCELRPGVAVALSERVLRVNHGGSSGSNSYLVGNPAAGWVLIDPGPADPAHLAALIAASAGRIRWIVRTTPAGAPAAQRLAAQTGAVLWDPARGDEVIALADGITLQAVGDSQPGARLAGLLLREEQTLFTGGFETLAAAHHGAAVQWRAPGQGFLIRAQR